MSNQMKNRFLIYQDMSFEFFGISKSLQKLYGCELYCILDLTNKQSKFFKNQKLVNYEKVWFLNEFIKIKNEKPDLDYLSKFEKNTGIELWKLIQNERIFYNYNPFYKFSPEQVLLIVEKILKLYEQILDFSKPDYLISSVTYNLHNRLLYELCKSKNIIVLMMTHARAGSRLIISESNQSIDNYDHLYNEIQSIPSIEEMELVSKLFSNTNNVNTKINNSYQHSKLSAVKAGFKYIISSDEQVKSHYTYYGRNKFRVLIYTIWMTLLKRIRFRFLQKYSIKNIEDEKFILFPLITDPEQSLLIESPFYTNILELIKNISKSIPIGYKLYVKEHPTMNLRDWRPISFYKKLLHLPNVKLIDPYSNSTELLKKMSLIITYSSTMGFQAAQYEKNTICISETIYSHLKSATVIKDLNNLPKNIQKSLITPFDKNDFLKFCKILEQNSFDTSGKLFNFMFDFLNQFLYGGFLADTDIDESKLVLLLQNYEETFDLIAKEYYKKIIQYNL